MNYNPHKLPTLQLILYYLTNGAYIWNNGSELIRIIKESARKLNERLSNKELAMLLLLHDGSEECNFLCACTRAIQIELAAMYNRAVNFRIAFVSWCPGMPTDTLILFGENSLTSTFYGDSVDFVTIINNEVVPVSPTEAFKAPQEASITREFIQSVHRSGIDIGPVLYDSHSDHPVLSNRINKFINYQSKVDAIIISQQPVAIDRYPFGLVEPEYRKGFAFPKDSFFFSVPGEALLPLPPRNGLYDHYLKLSGTAQLFDLSTKPFSDFSLLAYLYALKTEKLLDDTFVHGFNSYVQRRYWLMRKMGYSQEFINRIKKHYENPGIVREVRKNVMHFAKKYYGISYTAMVCMVYQPFIGQGRNLNNFLRREHPDLLNYEQVIRHLLSEGADSWRGHASLVQQLQEISGLKMEQLFELYNDTIIPQVNYSTI